LNAASFVAAILSATEVVTIIPAKYATSVAAILAVLNIYLRTQSVRPVALIGLNETKVVAVPKVGPPPPAGMAG
jgi:hypothetical protein